VLITPRPSSLNSRKEVILTRTFDFNSPRGTDGFQWDKVFIPDGFDKTYAELGLKRTGRSQEFNLNNKQRVKYSRVRSSKG
jgi:hypothetical protein